MITREQAYRIESKINQLLRQSDLTLAMELRQMATIQDVVAKVAEVKGVEDSAALALGTVHAELVRVRDLLAAGGDPALLDQVIADLDSSTQPLAAAIAANPAT